MKGDESPTTRRLRGAVVGTNLSLATTGLTLGGWLPNLTGLALGFLGSIFLGAAELVLAISTVFLYGSRDPEHVAIWNGLGLAALASIAAASYYGWTHIGPTGKAVLVLLILASILVRVTPPRSDHAALDEGGDERAVS